MRLTPEREAELRTMSHYSVAEVPALLAELDATRADRDDLLATANRWMADAVLLAQLRTHPVHASFLGLLASAEPETGDDYAYAMILLKLLRGGV